MMFLELGSGDQINTAAIEAVTIVRESEQDWQTWVVTAGNRYKDRSHRSEAKAIQNRARIVATLTGEHTCRNCGTALEPHRQFRDTWIHAVPISNPQRDGCDNPEPVALSPDFDLDDVLAVGGDA